MIHINPDKIGRGVLGKGFFGTVYPYNQENPTEKRYAIKHLFSDDLAVLVDYFPEIVIGFSLNHSNVLPILGYDLQKQRAEDDENSESWNLYIKLERMEGTLDSEIKKIKAQRGSFSQDKIVKTFYQLVCGLAYLHGRDIIHRDIKPSNLLYDKNGDYKIGDVGCAKSIPKDYTYSGTMNRAGTVNYQAPEIAIGNAQELKYQDLRAGDCYSLGLTILVMLDVYNGNDSFIRNLLPSTPDLEAKLTQKIAELRLKYNQGPLLDIIANLLKMDPAQRKTSTQVKRQLEEAYPTICKDNQQVPLVNQQHQQNLAQREAQVIEERKLEEPQLNEQQQIGSQREAPIVMPVQVRSNPNRQVENQQVQIANQQNHQNPPQQGPSALQLLCSELKEHEDWGELFGIEVSNKTLVLSEKSGYVDNKEIEQFMKDINAKLQRRQAVEHFEGLTFYFQKHGTKMQEEIYNAFFQQVRLLPNLQDLSLRIRFPFSRNDGGFRALGIGIMRCQRLKKLNLSFEDEDSWKPESVTSEPFKEFFDHIAGNNLQLLEQLTILLGSTHDADMKLKHIISTIKSYHNIQKVEITMAGNAQEERFIEVVNFIRDEWNSRRSLQSLSINMRVCTQVTRDSIKYARKTLKDLFHFKLNE